VISSDPSFIRVGGSDLQQRYKPWTINDGKHIPIHLQNNLELLNTLFARCFIFEN